MIITVYRFLLVLGLLNIGCLLQAQSPNRPFILIKQSDKAALLQKIENNADANRVYLDFIKKTDKAIELHRVDAKQFLSAMPFDLKKQKAMQIPPFLATRHTVNGEYRNLDNATDKEWAPAESLMRYLQIAHDCGIAYYLTNDEKYAQCGIDILYTFIKAVQQTELSTWTGRGGWLFPEDGFREVRVIGYLPPVIYDFLAPFILNDAKAFDFAKNRKMKFPLDEAQAVFRTYANITVNYGQTNSNHPVLEMPSLVYNALAMEDEAERNKLLSYFLTENTENQDALSWMANQFYKNKGDIWPESSQYTNHVAVILAELMLVVNRYDPTLRLGEKYKNVLFALPVLQHMVFPNGQLVRWGDGKRKGAKPPYASYEQAYLLGKMDGVPEITSTFGPLLKKAVNENTINIAGGILDLPYTLDDYDFKNEPLTLPRTDLLSHASIHLQRNISKTANSKHDLMCFVGGAHMVHGHAEGMNIELYGCGHVLGVDNGNGSYQKDIHENYSRLFAAHNTVIVNGNSQGEGGWVNLGINKVQLLAMEPMPRQTAISPYHSFSTTSFVDDKGDKAEAYQERTLALVRTSATSGYYVDVFRSKSKLPNEFHDYLYHNIGDKLDFLNADIKLKPTPDRFMANANLPWVQNKQYRNPGWHFFKDVNSSATYTQNVKARFTANLFEKPIFMDVHIPGFENREYTKVMAPHTFEAPEPYRNKSTPTLLIRKKGEAWEQPFVVVFEPFEGNKKNTAKNTSNNTIMSVEKLTQQGKYKGVKVVSKIEGKQITQYILTLQKNEEFIDVKLGISFSGTFAVVTLGADAKLQSLYIGDGDKLKYNETEISTIKPQRAIYKEF